MNSSEIIGQVIGSLIRNQQNTALNVSGQSVKTTKSRIIYETLKLNGQLKLIKKVPEDDSLQFDHPIKGDWNVYVWDGGYDDTKQETLEIQNF